MAKKGKGTGKIDKPKELGGKGYPWHPSMGGGKVTNWPSPGR